MGPDTDAMRSAPPRLCLRPGRAPFPRSGAGSYLAARCSSGSAEPGASPRCRRRRGAGRRSCSGSWINAAALTERAAWVAVQDEEHDPQRFWVSVLDALRRTVAGSSLVRPLTAAPDLDGWAVVERLLADLEPLEDQTWLLIDDAHELRSAEARRQLELLLMRGPQELRIVLATRHDLRLGLHRLRLEGELTEIRAANLRVQPR